MWVYRTTKQNEADEHWNYVVGFFHPTGEFEGIDDFADEVQAAWRVHFLNGGSATPLAE